MFPHGCQQTVPGLGPKSAMEEGQVRVPKLNQVANCGGCGVQVTVVLLAVQTDHDVRHPAPLQLIDLVLFQGGRSQNQKRVHTSAEHVHVQREPSTGRGIREMQQNKGVIPPAECPRGTFNSRAVAGVANGGSDNANASCPASGEPCRGG